MKTHTDLKNKGNAEKVCEENILTTLWSSFDVRPKEICSFTRTGSDWILDCSADTSFNQMRTRQRFEIEHKHLLNPQFIMSKTCLSCFPLQIFWWRLLIVVFSLSGLRVILRYRALITFYPRINTRYCAVQCSAVQCSAVHSAAVPPAPRWILRLHNIALLFSVWCTNEDFTLDCTALHCTALHCTELHYTPLHCTALHCNALVRPSLSEAPYNLPDSRKYLE
jgi:hypothetical protein